MLGEYYRPIQFPGGFWPEFSVGGGKSSIPDFGFNSGGENAGPDSIGLPGDTYGGFMSAFSGFKNAHASGSSHGTVHGKFARNVLRGWLCGIRTPRASSSMTPRSKSKLSCCTS